MVLQFFLILQNPSPPKVTKSTFKYIFFFIDAISLKIVLVRQKYICFEKQKIFWWETKHDKKIWIWKVENPTPWHLAILGDF